MTPDTQPADENLVQSEMISCNACKKEIHNSASMCPHCGAQRRTTRYKSKTVAALFAFFLGGFGAHRFYLGQWWGALYLLFFWLWIPGLIAFGEFVYFLLRDSRKWDEKYNEGIPAGPNDKSSSVLVTLLIIMGGFIFVAMLGIVAAVALPAYQDYTIRAKLAQSHTSAGFVMRAVESYAIDNRQWPSSINDVEVNKQVVTGLVGSVTVENGTVYVAPSQEVGVEGLVIYVPTESEGGVSWSCKESTIEPKYLPQECRQ